MPDDTYGNMAINGYGFGDGIVDNERQGMTHFQYYENSTNAINGEPFNAPDYYNYMRGMWKNGQRMRYGGNGVSFGTTDLECNYMFPDESDPWQWGTDGAVPDNNGWNEKSAGNYPGDRRGVGSTGPFDFDAGTMQQVDLAFTTGMAGTASDAVEALQRNVDNVRRQFFRDSTDSQRPFVYRPYSAAHEVSVDCVDETTFRLYPNPTSGRLTLVTDGPRTVALYDMMGRQLLVREVQGVATIDISHLPQGVYLLRMDGRSLRVVKQ